MRLVSMTKAPGYPDAEHLQTVKVGQMLGIRRQCAMQVVNLSNDEA